MGVEDELAVDGVADVALEGAESLLLGLAVSDRALEVDPALSSGIADLGDGSHVQSVVELAVAPSRHPMHNPSPRRKLNRSRAVVGGIGVAVGETSDVTRVADERRSEE